MPEENQWNVETIRGAFRFRTEPDGWEVLSTRVSGDTLRLVRVYRVPGSHLRVCRFIRGSGEPHLRGEWWDPAPESPSVVETLADAESLMEAFLITPLPVVDRATARHRSPRRRNGPRRGPAAS